MALSEVNGHCSLVRLLTGRVWGATSWEDLLTGWFDVVGWLTWLIGECWLGCLGYSTVLLTGRLDYWRSFMLRVDWGYSCLVGLELTLTVVECLWLTGAYEGVVWRCWLGIWMFSIWHGGLTLKLTGVQSWLRHIVDVVERLDEGLMIRLWIDWLWKSWLLDRD